MEHSQPVKWMDWTLCARGSHLIMKLRSYFSVLEIVFTVLENVFSQSSRHSGWNYCYLIMPPHATGIAGGLSVFLFKVFICFLTLSRFNMLNCYYLNILSILERYWIISPFMLLERIYCYLPGVRTNFLVVQFSQKSWWIKWCTCI